MMDASDFAGGYVHPDATYNRKFTARERKAIIAVKEAKMISEAVDHNAEKWEGCVPIARTSWESQVLNVSKPI